MKLIAKNFTSEHFQETRISVHNTFADLLEKIGAERALFGPQTFTENIMSLVWGEGLSETEHASQTQYTFEVERPWIVLEDGRVVFITSKLEGDFINFSAWEATEKYEFEGWDIPQVILGESLEFMVEFPSLGKPLILERDMTAEEYVEEANRVKAERETAYSLGEVRFEEWKKGAIAVNNRLPKDVSFVLGARYEKLCANGSVEIFE